MVVVMVVIGVIWWRLPIGTQKACAFSSEIVEKAHDIPLYCIDERKLPSGIVSHTASAHFGSGAVIYNVVDGNETLSVSLQKKPDEKQLANFVPNIIPLHFQVDTPIGKASIGVHEKQTIVSLPTTSSTWIIITGPASYDPDKMTRLLALFTLH